MLGVVALLQTLLKLSLRPLHVGVSRYGSLVDLLGLDNQDFLGSVNDPQPAVRLALEIGQPQK